MVMPKPPPPTPAPTTPPPSTDYSQPLADPALEAAAQAIAGPAFTLEQARQQIAEGGGGGKPPAPGAAGEKGLIQNALRGLGVEPTEKELRDVYVQLDRQYRVARTLTPAGAAPPKFQDYLDAYGLDDLQRLYGGVHDYYQGQEEARATKKFEQAVGKATGLQDRMNQRSFQDGIAALKKRYPGAKNLLDDPEVQQGLWNQWQDADQKARGAYRQAAQEPSIDPATGLFYPNAAGAQGFSGPAPLDVLQGMNLNSFFAQDPQMNAVWQGAQLRDAFDTFVAEPLRKAVANGTPQAQEQAEARIAALKRSLPLLQGQLAVAAKQDPNVTATSYLQSDNGQAILQRAGQQFEAGQQSVNLRLADQANSLAAKGYNLQEQASLLGVTPDDITAASPTQPAAALRQTYVNAATQPLPGGGTMKPEDAAAAVVYGNANIGARNAALDELTGGRFGQATRQQGILQANEANANAARQDYWGGVAGLKKQYYDLYAEMYGAKLGAADANGQRSVVLPELSNNPVDLQNMIRDLTPLVQQKRNKEAFTQANQPLIDQMNKDTGFSGSIDRYVAQNRRLASAGGEYTPDIYETREQVLDRSLPDVLKQYQSYLASRQRPQPEAARVL